MGSQQFFIFCISWSELNGDSQNAVSMSQPQESMNGALFGERVFADVVKDPEMKRSFWIILGVPKSNDKCCPHMKHTEEKMDRGEGNVKRKAEIGVMWLEAKESQEPPETGRGKKWLLPYNTIGGHIDSGLLASRNQR